MRSLPKRIMDTADALPEATPLCPGSFLHFGSRAAVDQALSRLARSGHLMRICQGIYMRPIRTRFGIRAPSVGKVISALADLWGETIVPSGGSAANRLGLTRQNPVRMVFLTSGHNRKLKLGGSVVELRHALRWQLIAPQRRVGDIVRALGWLGPQEVDRGLAAVVPDLSENELEELATARAVMPNWMAVAVSSHLQ